MSEDADLFQSYRPLLFSIAYRMLSSASEAEDVLQDAYLRFAGADERAAATIRSPKAYLSTIVTRLCLDRLKAARATREQYVGPWLPEPLLTAGAEQDPQRDAEQHESITMAFLVLLESLTPQERAVFLLREVFEYEYAEIAAQLGLSAANCRQIFHRARAQIAAGRPRFQAAPDQQRRLVERFFAATQRGDVQSLTSLLAQDVTFVADSGGKATAARRPLHGRDRVLKLMVGLFGAAVRGVSVAPGELRWALSDVNGEPALLVWAGEQLETVFVCSVADEQISAIRAIRNPDKLAYLQHQLRERGQVGVRLTARGDARPDR